MDVIIIGLLSSVLFFIYRPPKGAKVEVAAERIAKNPTLNPEMIHDEHAFMEIANELGFH